MLAASVPVHDWQFWVVTVVALLALVWIGRGLYRAVAPRGKRRGGTHRATLTVGGKPVEPSRDRRGPGA